MYELNALLLKTKVKENACFASSYISQIHTQFSGSSGGGLRKLALVSIF
jgi:hypothetical protein